MTLPESFTLSVSPAAAEAVRAYYVSQGYVVEELEPAPQPVHLYLRRPLQVFRLPRPGERGFDLSHHNGPQTEAGLRQAMEAGYTWCAFKLGEGQVLDVQAINTAKLCRKIGLPFIVYYFWRYDQPAAGQIAALAQMLSAEAISPPPLGLAVDLEECLKWVVDHWETVDPTPYAAGMAGNLRQFLLEAGRRVQPIIIYSRSSWIARWLSGATYLAECEHWPASWPFNQPVYGVNRPTVHPFWRNPDGTPNSRVIAWQFYAPRSGLRYQIMVPGLGDIDQNYWLAGPRG